MDKYMYVSLAERQRNKWRETEEHPLTKPYQPNQTPIEALYKSIWTKVPAYMISLLKLLLAAAPTANKGEILQHDQAQQSLQIENDPKWVPGAQLDFLRFCSTDSENFWKFAILKKYFKHPIVENLWKFQNSLRLLLEASL